MKKEKQTPKQTWQDFADGFAGYAKTLTGTINKFVYRRDDPEVAQLYITWRQIIANLIKIMSESIKNRPSLPELPTLIENNYYAGLTRLAEFCENAARETAKEETPKADVTCDHSPDYHSVTWLGQPYTFNTTQAKIIKLLWESESAVHLKTIAEEINTSTDRYRLIDSFRRSGKYHPAWKNQLIKRVGRGAYILNKNTE